MSLEANSRLVYTCKFCCDFLLLMDVNEWISYECSDEGAMYSVMYSEHS